MERLNPGKSRRSAWWEHEPQVAFSVAAPAEAVERLVDSMMDGD